jgi:hypothetical protein
MLRGRCAGSCRRGSRDLKHWESKVNICNKTLAKLPNILIKSDERNAYNGALPAAYVIVDLVMSGAASLAATTQSKKAHPTTLEGRIGALWKQRRTTSSHFLPQDQNSPGGLCGHRSPKPSALFGDFRCFAPCTRPHHDGGWDPRITSRAASNCSL